MLAPTDEEAWAEAIFDLSTDVTARQQRIQAGLERVSAFTWRRSVSRFLDILEGVAR